MDFQNFFIRDICFCKKSSQIKIIIHCKPKNTIFLMNFLIYSTQNQNCVELIEMENKMKQKSKIKNKSFLNQLSFC